MTELLRDVFLVMLGAVMTLGVSFALALWLLHDTVIPGIRRGDKPGD